MSAVLTDADARIFERCMAVGGYAVFPTDTVYGLACDPDAKEALQQLLLIKRRSPAKPSAVLFFDLDLALETLAELDERTRGAMSALLPGGVTLLLPNPARRFPLACGADPETLGIRVPSLGIAAAALHHVTWPVLQTSANLAGGPDPRTLQDVPAPLRDAADLLLDAGELPGTPSTVIDLRAYGASGDWSIVRQGLVGADDVAAALE